MDDPFAFWVANAMRLEAKGHYLVDDWAWGCDPVDLDGDGWWAVFEDL